MGEDVWMAARRAAQKDDCLDVVWDFFFTCDSVDDQNSAVLISLKLNVSKV